MRLEPIELRTRYVNRSKTKVAPTSSGLTPFIAFPPSYPSQAPTSESSAIILKIGLMREILSFSSFSLSLSFPAPAPEVVGAAFWGSLVMAISSGRKVG